MAFAAIVEGCKRRLTGSMTSGAQPPIRLGRAMVIRRVASQSPPFHGKQFEMASGAVAVCFTDVAFVVEIHVTQSRCILDRRRQRRQVGTRVQLGMAIQAIILGGECRPVFPVACSTGSFVLFRGCMQIVSVIQHPFRKGKDLVMTTAAISLADRYMASMIELRRAQPGLHQS